MLTKEQRDEILRILPEIPFLPWLRLICYFASIVEPEGSQMTELAARLRDDVTWVLHMATVGGQNEGHPEHARYIKCVARIRAALDSIDLIASMAQRVPLSDERVEAAFADDSHESFADFLSGVRFAEQAHGIRSEK